jgi:predicted DsbA family dithiol-disulfide isomerase
MKIDVFHDTACPWCRIGKQHLKLALAGWEGEPVAVAYHTFFLNDSIPPEGYAFRPYMQAKGGNRVPLEQFFEMPRQRGAEVGLVFNFEQIEKAPNTTLSHWLIALAPEEQKEAVIDAVYAAYFEHGRDIGNLDVLVDIAAECGLDAETIRQQLQSDAGLDEVLAEAEWARQQGISGVPFFIIDGRYAFSGAQPPHMIRRVLDQVSSEQ